MGGGHNTGCGRAQAQRSRKNRGHGGRDKQKRDARTAPPRSSAASFAEPNGTESSLLSSEGTRSMQRSLPSKNGYADSEHTEMSSIFHGEMSKNVEVIFDSRHTQCNTPHYKDREDEAARARSEPPAPRESACPNVGQTNCRRHENQRSRSIPGSPTGATDRPAARTGAGRARARRTGRHAHAAPRIAPHVQTTNCDALTCVKAEVMQEDYAAKVSLVDEKVEKLGIDIVNLEVPRPKMIGAPQAEVKLCVKDIEMPPKRRSSCA